jgi:LacI family transcriptional regulator
VVRMSEVAAEAGVSVATVSRVLSGTRSVGADVQRAVLDAAQKLGYRTNHVARSLRRQATQTVGMVVPYIANPFFPFVVQAVELNLQQMNYEIFLCDAQDDPEVERRRIEALLDRQVDGLFVIPCDSSASAPALVDAARRVPLVQIDRRATEVEADFVGVDNESGIEQVVKHLRSTGRTRFIFVGAESQISTARERLDAFLRVVRTAGGSDPDVLLGDFSAEWGRTAAGQVARGPLPDAIVCGNDLIALGVLLGLRSAGIEVPGDVAVTGFDDVGFIDIGVGLTSARQPIDELGRQAVNLLSRRLRNKDAPPVLMRLGLRLVTRTSTAVVT